MKLHQKYALIFLIITFVWCGLQCNKSSIESPVAQWYVDVFPIYMVMMFGCYCLGKLGFDVLVFNDYPEEIVKLGAVSYLFNFALFHAHIRYYNNGLVTLLNI